MGIHGSLPLHRAESYRRRSGARGRAKAAHDIIVDEASQITGRDFRNWHNLSASEGSQPVRLFG